MAAICGIVPLVAAICGIVLGGFIACVVTSLMPETWQVIAGVIVMFGPGWMISTIYARFKG